MLIEVFDAVEIGGHESLHGALAFEDELEGFVDLLLTDLELVFNAGNLTCGHSVAPLHRHLGDSPIDEFHFDFLILTGYGREGDLGAEAVVLGPFEADVVHLVNFVFLDELLLGEQLLLLKLFLQERLLGVPCSLLLEHGRVLALEDDAALASVPIVRLIARVVDGPRGVRVGDLAVAGPLLRDLVGERGTRHPFHSVVGALTAAHVIVLIETPRLRVLVTIGIFILSRAVVCVGRHTDLVSGNERRSEHDSSGKWREH